MNMSEYMAVKDYSYDEYCQYLNKKYGPVRNTYGKKGCTRPEDGLFVHHVREDQIASLSNNKIRKANDPILQEPQNLVYCNYLEHLLLHIKIGELTACGRNLGLVGPFVYIIPALRVFFENGHKNPKVNPKYFEVVANDGDVFEELLIRYNQLIEDIDLLLDHNQTLYVEMVRMLEEKKKACVVLGTGLGKTTTALQYVWKHGCKALVVGPNNLIKSGWDRYREWVHTMTYASFAKSFSLIDYSKFGIVILDETHHVGYDDEKDLGAKVWSQGIQYLFEHDIPVLGLTATPERTDGINIGETVFKDCVCQGLSIEEAIEQGIVHPFSYITSIYDPEGLAEEYKGRGDKELIGQLDLALNNLPTVKTTLLQYRPATDKIKGIVFIAEIGDKDEAIKIMKDAYPHMEFRAIDSSMPDDEVIENREWFEKAEEGWLVAINMISEGAHYPHVNTLVMFRHTTSYLVYTQQIGRIITLTKDEDPNAVVFDFVNNVESVEYNDRKIKSKKTMNIKKVFSAIKLAAAKSPQVIVKDETRDIVDCIRKIKKYESVSWEDWEIDIIRTYYPTEGAEGCQRRIDEYWESLHPGALTTLIHHRSLSTITCYANRQLNLYCKGMPWSIAEDAIIKEHYPHEGIDAVLTLLPNRTKPSIQARIHKLGIKSATGWWTEEEDELIKKYYAQEKVECYKRLPGKTKKAVYNRAQFLGLSTKITRQEVWCAELNQSFASVAQAEKIGGSGIFACLQKDLESIAGGYHWAYTTDAARVELLKKYIGQPKFGLYPIVCRELNKQFDNYRVAAKELNIAPALIKAALQESWRTAGGYHFVYSNMLDTAIEAKPIKNAKKVICIETGKTYDTVHQAMEETGCGNISACCKDHSKTSHGYHWEYVEE